MIKALILDLNGIFLESEYLSKRIEKEYDIPGDKFFEGLEKVLQKTRVSDAEPFFRLMKPYLKDLNFNISEEEFFNFWFEGERLNPKAMKLVKDLKNREIKVFILSRNFRERTKYYREKFPQIFEIVDQVYFSWETGFVKPDPGAYEMILQENDLRPEQCLYFDDSDKNVESAKNIGLKAFLYKDIDKIRNTLEDFKVII